MTAAGKRNNLKKLTYNARLSETISRKLVFAIVVPAVIMASGVFMEAM